MLRALGVKKKMPLSQLTDEEKSVVFECLKCVATGKVILHDWEFQTIMGIEAQELLAIVKKISDIDDSDETANLAINNSINNLLGYPHGKHSKWNEFISVPESEVARVFAKWRGEPVSGYFDGIK